MGFHYSIYHVPAEENGFHGEVITHIISSGNITGYWYEGKGHRDYQYQMSIFDKLDVTGFKYNKKDVKTFEEFIAIFEKYSKN